MSQLIFFIGWCGFAWLCGHFYPIGVLGLIPMTWVLAYAALKTNRDGF